MSLIIFAFLGSKSTKAEIYVPHDCGSFQSSNMSQTATLYKVSSEGEIRRQKYANLYSSGRAYISDGCVSNKVSSVVTCSAW